MSDATFRDDDESLHYAMARYACQWLDERGQLWSFYRAWRDDVTDDPTGERRSRGDRADAGAGDGGVAGVGEEGSRHQA